MVGSIFQGGGIAAQQRLKSVGRKSKHTNEVKNALCEMPVGFQLMYRACTPEEGVTRLWVLRVQTAEFGLGGDTGVGDGAWSLPWRTDNRVQPCTSYAYKIVFLDIEVMQEEKNAAR